MASQSGLDNWTLGKWASYYEDPNRERVRNVISLELSSSPLKNKVVPPKIVRDIDWVANFWPKERTEKGDYPQVIRYCLMSPGQSWTDWHIDFSASSVSPGSLCFGRTWTERGHACLPHRSSIMSSEVARYSTSSGLPLTTYVSTRSGLAIRRNSRLCGSVINATKSTK